MIDHVNAVVVPVRDVEKCASFYQDKLGFKLNHKDDQSAFLAIGGKGGLVLGPVSINEVTRLIRLWALVPEVYDSQPDIQVYH